MLLQRNTLPQIYFKNQVAAPGTSFPKHLPLNDVISLVTDSFTSATERHIEVRSLIFESRPLPPPTSLVQCYEATAMWCLIAFRPKFYPRGIN